MFLPFGLYPIQPTYLPYYKPQTYVTYNRLPPLLKNYRRLPAPLDPNLVCPKWLLADTKPKPFNLRRPFLQKQLDILAKETTFLEGEIRVHVEKNHKSKLSHSEFKLKSLRELMEIGWTCLSDDFIKTTVEVVNHEIEGWCSENSIHSFTEIKLHRYGTCEKINHLVRRLVDLPGTSWREAVLHLQDIESDTINPSTLLTALLTHQLYHDFQQSPFFFANALSADNLAGQRLNNIYKILKHVNCQKSEKWRAQFMRMLIKCPLESENLELVQFAFELDEGRFLEAFMTGHVFGRINGLLKLVEPLLSEEAIRSTFEDSTEGQKQVPPSGLTGPWIKAVRLMIQLQTHMAAFTASAVEAVGSAPDGALAFWPEIWTKGFERDEDGDDQRVLCPAKVLFYKPGRNVVGATRPWRRS